MQQTLPALLLIFLSFTSFAQDFQTHKLSNKLLLQLESSTDLTIPVTLLLEDRLNVTTLADQLERQRASRSEKVQRLITDLQAKAKATQAPVLNVLQQSAVTDPESIRPLWITNIILAQTDRATIARLSHLQEIEWIDFQDSPPALEAEVVNTPPVIEDGIEPGLAAINAPALWAMGYTGYGTKALILDTGTDVRHPALDHNYWGLYVNKEQAWTGYADEPEDCQIHGTHVAGTVLGLDRANNDTIGVAFNAMWLAAPGIGCGPGSITNVGAFETFQWALDPDGNSATTDDMPDVINNSWGWPNPDGGHCNGSWVDIFNAMELAGVAVIFAAGNEGPDEMSLRAPQNINTDLVNCFSVGAILGYQSSFPIAEFSSIGPSLCGGSGSLLIKPEVVAPGAAVRSSVTGGGYNQLQGTSMASPHVAGAALLLIEAFPDASGKEILEALYYSATDLGEPGEDNVYGRGIIDLLKAFEYLQDHDHIAVSPSVVTDAMLLDIEMQHITCTQGEHFLRVSFENGGSSELTELVVSYQFNDPGQSGGSYQWSGSLAEAAREEVSVPLQNLPAGEYDMVVELSQPNGLADQRPLNNRLKTSVILIDEEALKITQSQLNEDLCNGSHALLQANYQGQGTIQWYSEAVDGDLLGSGKVFTSPAIQSDTVFFLDAQYKRHIGPADTLSGLTLLQTNGYEGKGIRFDCTTPFILKAVKVYAEEAGMRFIKLEGENALYAQKIVSLPGPGEHRIELNFRVPAADELKLVLDFGAPLYHSLNPDNFPFSINGLVELKENDFGPADAYYFFYDWEIEHQHLCGRTAVPVALNESLAAPLAGFEASADSLDLETNNMISFTDSSENAESWQWSFGDGTFSSEQHPEHGYTQVGSYPVVLTVFNADGCSDVAMQTIVVTDGTMVSNKEATLPGIRLMVFPNPAREMLFLQFDLEGPALVHIQLIDVAGRQLGTREMQLQGAELVEWPLQDFGGGMYFLVTEMGGKQSVQKVILTGK